MAATLSGAVKARIESSGIGIAAFRDRPPPNALLPYAVVTEGISKDPQESGDFGAAATQLEVREEAQIDVWQQYRDPVTNAITEDPDLATKVVRSLRGKALANVGTGRVYPVRVTASRRIPSGEDNIIRDTISIVVVRQIGVPL